MSWGGGTAGVGWQRPEHADLSARNTGTRRTFHAAGGPSQSLEFGKPGRRCDRLAGMPRYRVNACMCRAAGCHQKVERAVFALLTKLRERASLNDLDG